MKRETEKSLVKIKAEGLERFLTTLLKSIDDRISREDKSKSIRELCMQEGYKEVREVVLGQVQEIKDKVHNYLIQNKLKIDVKNNSQYLVDEESGKTIKLSKLVSKKLNLLGIYATSQEEDLANEAVNQILGILMRRSFLHQTKSLTSGDFSFENIVSLSEIKKEPRLSLDGFDVIIQKEETEVSLPYIFTRIVSLNEKDAFKSEQEMNNLMKSLFLNKSGKKQKSKTPQETLKERNIKIKAIEQDGRLLFCLVNAQEDVIQFDVELTKRLIVYMKNQVRSFAKPFNLDSEIQNTDNARLDYLCRCGEFLSLLYQNGYIADILQTSIQSVDKKENLENGFYLEDKGILRIILPFGIDGDIEDLNKTFRECFGRNIAMIKDRKELASIMGWIIVTPENKFAREEYLKQRVSQREFLTSFEKLQGEITSEFEKTPLQSIDFKGLINNASERLQKLFKIYGKENEVKRRCIIAKRENKKRRFKFAPIPGKQSEQLALPQFDSRVIIPDMVGAIDDNNLGVHTYFSERIVE